MALVCTLVVASACLATAARADTLLEAYALARQKDPKYRAAVAEARASSTMIDQAKAGFLPTVKFQVEDTQTRQQVISSENPVFGVGVKTFPTFSQTLSVSQVIFRKDVIERYRQAEAIVRQANYTVLAAEQDLQLRTVVAYLVVLAARDSLELAVAERDAVGKLLESAQEKRKMGLGTITQQHDAEARHAVTVAREIEARNKLKDAQQALREITGTEVLYFQSLRGDMVPDAPQPSALEPWLEKAMEQNMILHARQEAVEVARQELERQRSGHYPNLMLLLSKNRKKAGSTLYGNGSDVDTTEMTLQLNVPIYEGGMTSAVTEEAAQRFEKALEELEMERRSVDRTTRAAFENTLSGIHLINALKQAVTAQASALEAKTEGYKAGLNSVLPLLDAQRDLYLARRDYAQARYDYLVNRLRLKIAAGTLSEEDIAATSSAALQ